MRSFILLFAFGIFFSVSGLAQVESNFSDSAITHRDTRKRMDLLFVDLNWDYLLGLPGTVNQRPWGRGVSVGIMFDQPLTKNNNVSLGIGAAFQTHNYYTNAEVRSTDTAGGEWQSRWFTPDESQRERGKISLNYVDVPFELRFRTNPNKNDLRWKFAVGGKVGYLIQAHEKVIQNINDTEFKFKYYHYPTVNRIRYGITARAGYGSIMFSAFYSLSNTFNANHFSGQQNALSLGISIVPF